MISGIDSEKENRLSNDIAQYTSELSFQKRFFKILEQLKEANYAKSYYLKNLYIFSAETKFEETIRSIEDNLIT